MNETSGNQSTAKPNDSLVDIFISTWTSPARTAKRLHNLSLLKAFAIHVASALAAVAAIITLAAIEDVRSASIIDGVLKVLGEYADMWAREPFLVSLITIASAGGIELAFVGFALNLMPWGARDERLRNSYKHSLCQTWLRTPHIVVVIMLAGSVATGLDMARRTWQPPDIPPELLPIAPEAPAFNGDQAAYDKALAQYQVDLDALQIELGRARASWSFRHATVRPWYASARPEFTLLPLGTLLVLWFLWAYLRAVGVERFVRPIERPPLCEACGYNLTTMATDARCPECGQPVIESLGPDVRNGPAWSNRKTTGVKGAWFSTAVGAICEPSKLGAQFRLTTHETAHRAFMLRVLPFVFLTGYGALMTLIVLEGNGSSSWPDPVAFVGCGMFGAACTLGAIGFTLKIALIVGLFMTWRYKRNMLPAATQAAAYLSGYLLAWCVIGAVTGLVVEHLDRSYTFSALQDATGIYRGLLATMTWLIPNGLCALYYMILVARVTAAARYANK